MCRCGARTRDAVVADGAPVEGAAEGAAAESASYSSRSSTSIWCLRTRTHRFGGTVSRRSCAHSWPRRHAWAWRAPYEPFGSLNLLRLARQVDLPVGAVACAMLNLYGRTTL